MGMRKSRKLHANHPRRKAYMNMCIYIHVQMYIYMYIKPLELESVEIWMHNSGKSEAEM